MKATALCFLVATVCTAVLAAKAATTAGVSPSGAIAWSVNPDNGELNLVRANGQGEPSKLCDTTSTANLGVHFSADDKHVFVTDGTASLGIHVTLYQRSSGLEYQEVEFDFDLATQKLAMEAETGKKITATVLDRSYLKCLGWSRDGQWAVLQLSGSGKLNGKRVEITGFKCAYHPAKGEFTNDLRVMR
jgi:hypothetical protein